MEKRQKDLLRALVAQLRHTLIGTWDEAGKPVRGDLDRELERLGVAPDGTLSPLDALPNATAAERRVRRIIEAQLAGLPARERRAACRCFLSRKRPRALLRGRRERSPLARNRRLPGEGS